ncbi:MAG: acyl-CoA thioester hydrolase/BAAT C-terminal domain-containing protein [Pseudomonadota bacterium]
MRVIADNLQIEPGDELFIPLHKDIQFRIEECGNAASLRINSQLIDDAKDAWRSWATFRANSDGVVDFANDAPTDGAFNGVDIGGLFWSVTPDSPTHRLDFETLASGASLLPESDALGDLRYQLEFCTTNGAPIIVNVVRQRLSNSVDCERMRSGDLRGLLFQPRFGRPKGAVLILGGSEGGIVGARTAALAWEGYAALALGYFNYEDRPRAAFGLPLEYFERALAFLAERFPGCKRAIWGGSRGAEAALLTSINFPGAVDAVVGWVPSHLIHDGFDMDGGEDFSASRRAMWTLRDREIAGAPFKEVDAKIRIKRSEKYRARPGYSYADEFFETWRKAGDDSEYHIPVERLAAPLLLVSAGDDRLWPSKMGAERIMRRLDRHSAKIQREHIVLCNAGHAVGMPNEPRPFSDTTFWRDGYSGVDGGFVNMGGAPSTNALAAREGWRVVTAFLAKHLDATEQ